MNGLAAPLTLVLARARRRPQRWLAPSLGLALGIAFAGAVAAEGVIAGDQGARAVLSELSPLQRSVRVSWPGPTTSATQARAWGLLRGLGLARQSQTTLLDPVRLDGLLVQPAAIAPLDPWLAAGRAPPPCTRRSCPVLVAGGSVARRSLSAAGVRLQIVGTAALRSAAPLGFLPGAYGAPPVLLSDDVAGLDAVAGLNGVYRTHSRLASLSLSGLNSWDLAGLEQRLQRAQASLVQSASQFSLAAPFSALDAARAQAAAAPRRMLLMSAAALAALAMFVILAAHGLRRDQRAEIERLRGAGARSAQSLVFQLGEAAWLCAWGAGAGAAGAIGLAALLAGRAGIPAGGLLAHSLLTPGAAGGLVGTWLGATLGVTIVLLSSSPRLGDLIAAAALAALAFGVLRGASGDNPLAALMVPLTCVLAAAIVFRSSAALLRAAERISRRGPPLLALAVVNLARAPVSPALAIAFITVSTGLGGFTLAYRATLLRGTADEAAQQVPLDATVAPAGDFTTPLGLASLGRWRSLADGHVYPVRRTYASYADQDVTVTVAALGVPAGALAGLRGWRASDGSAPLRTLAARLRLPGPTRRPGPGLGNRARWLSLRLSRSTVAAAIVADLRRPDGAVTQVALGAPAPRAHTARARLPAGSWELEALELDEATGTVSTNGHQNAENPGAATQGSGVVSLGPLQVADAAGRRLASIDPGRWRGVGAATVIAGEAGRVSVRFSDSGMPGILRPRQPSDEHPLPVLADPGTAATATRAGLLALSVDGLPVTGRVVGVLKRFPTLNLDSSGFIVAQEAQLAAALDAQLPGQGRPDELWIQTPRPARLRGLLLRGPLAKLSSAFRADVERGLRSSAIARGVLDTLIAASVVSALLAVVGVLTAFVGSARDRAVERDLAVQCLGRRGLARELRLRVALAALLGVSAGLLLAVALTGLTVASVLATTTLAAPDPPLVAVTPWGELALWCLAALAALGGAIVLATGRRRRWSMS